MRVDAVKVSKGYDVHVSPKSRLFMKMQSWGRRIATTGMVCFVCLAGSAGVTRIAPQDYLHRSSLHATVTMANGSARTVTLQGVGCAIDMCSRVRAKDINADSVWLDGLASVREISHNADGPVKAILKFKDGAERPASIVAGNRVLYVQDRFGHAERLDLASLTEIQFE